MLMPFVDKRTSKKQKTVAETGKLFIGRANELRFFIEQILKPEKPTHNMVSIYGQAGVGKSTLLTRFSDETHQGEFRDYCKVATIDERQTTPVAVLWYHLSKVPNTLAGNSQQFPAGEEPGC
jgi:putative ribosome biogenesis GTPase RsgA